MKSLLVLLSILGSIKTVAQVDWSKTSNWKIYKVPEPKVFTISIDSLTPLKNKSIRQDSILMFITASAILPDSIKPMWMGAWVATYEINGQAHKIQISSYGGFFYDQSTDRFYQIPFALKTDWMAFIHQNLSLLW